MKQQNQIKIFKIKFGYITTIKRSKNGHKHVIHILVNIPVASSRKKNSMFPLMPYFFKVIRSFRLST